MIRTSSSIRSTSRWRARARRRRSRRRRCPRRRSSRVRAAEHDRRDEHARLVDLARLEEGAGEVRAALEQERLDVARAELVERVLHARGLVLAGGDDHVHAGGLERLRPRCARRRASRRRSAAPRPRRCTSCESSGRRASESNTTRRGWRATPSTRAVSCGSSASAVPMPDGHGVGLGAPAVRARAARLAGDPLGVAGAGGDLAVERHRGLEDHERAAGAGVLAERLVEQPRGLARSRRPRSRPRRPRRAGCPRPRPAAFAVGSSEAITTRAMPASTIASVHGGVRPWWQHGSSDTYMRRARRGPRCTPRAPSRSACGSPGGCVEALADHAPVLDDHGADERVRARLPARAPGQLDGPQKVAARRALWRWSSGILKTPYQRPDSPAAGLGAD